MNGARVCEQCAQYGCNVYGADGIYVLTDTDEMLLEHTTGMSPCKGYKVMHTCARTSLMNSSLLLPLCFRAANLASTCCNTSDRPGDHDTCSAVQKQRHDGSSSSIAVREQQQQ